ncbi:MAG: TauD/TfdA family dioxygenase [Pseudomonadota bacterium]|nr:TauD/TfdA family dioxygenase [Pseudomonadota bacterium]
MVSVVPNDAVLGATVLGLDLSQDLTAHDFGVVLSALGRFGVLRIPDQTIDAAALMRFSGRFGGLEVNVANTFQEPGHPEVMILSNIKENGKPIGLADAGQDWHTDMSYSKEIAFANVLYGIKIPRRDGVPLGGTEFANMYAAYDGLPDDVRTRLDGMTVLHDFNKFWEEMRRRPGSTRQPLTEEQRRRKPPVSHPIFLTHPITGRKVLYANPGYAVRVNELPEEESDEMLHFLFEHQVQPKYRYMHRWTENDVLIWDDICTLHNAWPDYGPDERRLIKRCQVIADRVFDPDFPKSPFRIGWLTGEPA